jgi:hypothetical protein
MERLHELMNDSKYTIYLLILCYFDIAELLNINHYTNAVRTLGYQSSLDI